MLSPDDDGLATAAAMLARGGLVAMPTETVYGLAADARNDAAVAAVYAAKGRPAFNPLIVHVPDLDAARRYGVFDDQAEALAAAFWPGPLTLVVRLREEGGLSRLVTAGSPTVALRVPAHPVARALLRMFGGPLAAPSANPSGRVSPTTAAHVLAGLDGAIDAVIDGGACAVGLESTIVDCTGSGAVLRAGGIPSEDVAPFLTGAPTGGDRPMSPGQLASHYAPRGRVRLNATQAAPGEVLVGFGPIAGDMTLSARGDLAEAAAALFNVLHRLDAMKADAIAFAPVPETGLGVAINDRLRRAAAPRD